MCTSDGLGGEKRVRKEEKGLDRDEGHSANTTVRVSPEKASLGEGALSIRQPAHDSKTS